MIFKKNETLTFTTRNNRYAQVLFIIMSIKVSICIKLLTSVTLSHLSTTILIADTWDAQRRWPAFRLPFGNVFCQIGFRYLSRNKSVRCCSSTPQEWGTSHSSVSSTWSAFWLFHTSCMMLKAFSTPLTGKRWSRFPLMKSIGLGHAKDAMWG